MVGVDERSLFRKYQETRSLKRFCLQAVQLGIAGACFVRWARSSTAAGWRQQVDRAVDAVRDWRDSAVRTARALTAPWIPPPPERDPLVLQILRRPWSRVRRSELPLLPDAKHLKLPAQLPTLVLDIDGILGHTSYDTKNCWKVLKRPYADEMIQALLPYFEIILWSGEPFPTAQRLVNQWALPVMGVLHREDCTIGTGNRFWKDLSRLGRPLSRVVHLRAGNGMPALQSRNELKVEEFDFTRPDDYLQQLTATLKDIGWRPGDVRPHLERCQKQLQNPLSATHHGFNSAWVANKVQGLASSLAQAARPSSGKNAWRGSVTGSYPVMNRGSGRSSEQGVRGL